MANLILSIGNKAGNQPCRIYFCCMYIYTKILLYMDKIGIMGQEVIEVQTVIHLSYIMQNHVS